MPSGLDYARRGDHIWLLGCVTLFLAPSLILFTVKLLAVASAWFALWLVYLLFRDPQFPPRPDCAEELSAAASHEIKQERRSI